MTKKKVLCIIGTRPEVIKMAPVIERLELDPEIESTVISVAQHREMLDQMLDIFRIQPQQDLNIMEANQTLPQLTAKLPLPLDETLEKMQPDLVLAQGDTTTAFMVSLACFYRKIPFGHVEAGLRTWKRDQPYPEEMNRVLIGRLAALHFAPTEKAKQNLIAEGIPENSIYVTGNTVIDALHSIIKQNLQPHPEVDPTKRLILVTAHRRENIGKNLKEICRALRTIVTQNPDVQILFPVHKNPKVSETVYQELGTTPGIILTEPMEYDTFVTTMKQAYLILSDSGGVQEEAPSLGTPVLILREETERPEGVEVGANRIIGTDHTSIVETTQELLDNKAVYEAMIKKDSPYGDGRSAEKIVAIIKSQNKDSYVE